jgi:hypothetical protein
MKKIFLALIIGCVILPSNTKAQNDGAAAAAVIGGVLAIGSSIGAIEQFKERLEHKAVEEILTNHNMTNFRIKTSTLDGVSIKDVSSMGVVTYVVDNFDDNKKYILFSFSNSGWVDDSGVFSSVKWKLFDTTEWNNLMKVYIETASRKKISIDDVGLYKIDQKGVKKGKEYVVFFKKLDGDTYLTHDYSDEFKIVFNEGRLGLYVKQTEGKNTEYSNLRGSLVQIRKKAIMRAHAHINFQ